MIGREGPRRSPMTREPADEARQHPRGTAPWASSLGRSLWAARLPERIQRTAPSDGRAHRSRPSPRPASHRIAGSARCIGAACDGHSCRRSAAPWRDSMSDPTTRSPSMTVRRRTHTGGSPIWQVARALPAGVRRQDGSRMGDRRAHGWCAGHGRVGVSVAAMVRRLPRCHRGAHPGSRRARWRTCTAAKRPA